MKNTCRFFLLSILLPLFASSQSLQVQLNNSNFGSVSELQTDSLFVQLFNNGSQAAQVNGYVNWNNYDGRQSWLKDSVFAIPPGGNYGLYVYFHPTQNVTYDLPLVLLTDSHYGAIPIQLQAQGVFSNAYYNSTQNLEGQALKNQFTTLLAQNYNQLSYNSARDNMYATLDNVNGQVTCVYTGRSATFSTRAGANANSINTEHTMPQSTFGSASPMQTDIHHLFPTDASANSVRSNYPFGIVNSPTWSVGGSRYASSLFEPRDVQKGNSARALLYFALRYGDYGGFIAGMESILRNWHLQDAPDAFERGRNDGIYQLQNNRNPLVDYPQFEERLGSFTGNADLQASSGWAIYPDTLWLTQGEQACLSLVNTGTTSMTISGASGTTSDFQLGTLPQNLTSLHTECITVQANSNASFGPVAVQINTSLGSQTVYVASAGNSTVAPPNIPSLDGFSADSLSANSVLLQVDKPDSAYGQDWDGVIVFASKVPFQQFWSNNTAEAQNYMASETYGSGSFALSNGSDSAFCVYNSSNSSDDVFIVDGLRANTAYYFGAWMYRRQSGQDDLFGAKLQIQSTTWPIVNDGGATSCDGELIISEYIEGSSFNKCIELTNASDSNLLLDAYQLYLTSNNNSNTNSYNLSGNLASGESFVLCHGSSAASFQSQADVLNSSVINFNGNDLISLIHIASGDTVDRVGDPNNLGANHTVDDDGQIRSLANVTLVRADSVRSGTGNWSRTRKQWHALPSNTYDSLGSHHLTACASVDPLVPFTYAPSGHRYGEAIALNDVFAMVGAPGRNGVFPEAHDSTEWVGNNGEMGAVYAFHKQNMSWVEWQRLQAPDRNASDAFGSALALTDSLLVVGAPGRQNGQGAAYCFRLLPTGQWQYESTLTQSGTSFGASLAMDDNTLAVASPEGSGEVNIYVRNGLQWILVDQLDPLSSSPQRAFGFSLDLNNDTLCVGAPGLNDEGRLFIYANGPGGWSLMQELSAPDATTGQGFGHSVGRIGDQIIVGEPNHGSAYVFWNNGTIWVPFTTLRSGVANDFFGASLAGDVLAGQLYIGAEGADNEAGKVYGFQRNNVGIWSETHVLTESNPEPGERYGHVVKNRDGEIFIGAPLRSTQADRPNKTTGGAIHIEQAF